MSKYSEPIGKYPTLPFFEAGGLRVSGDLFWISASCVPREAGRASVMDPSRPAHNNRVDAFWVENRPFEAELLISGRIAEHVGHPDRLAYTLFPSELKAMTEARMIDLDPQGRGFRASGVFEFFKRSSKIGIRPVAPVEKNDDNEEG